MSKLSRIPPMEMRAPRSRQDIFIPYPVLNIFSSPVSRLDFVPHLAFRQTYVGPSYLHDVNYNSCVFFWLNGMFGNTSQT